MAGAPCAVGGRGRVGIKKGQHWQDYVHDSPDVTSGICSVPVSSHSDAKGKVPGCDK